MPNPENLKPFTKGDPGINRKGRPRDFGELRNLAQLVAHEVARSGGEEVVIDGHRVTIAEAIIRSSASSKTRSCSGRLSRLRSGRCRT